MAVSTDDAETMERFRADLKAPFPFLPDPEGKLTGLFDVKAPVVRMAKRYTFVIDSQRKVLRIDQGSDAIDPTTAIQACPIRQGKKAAP